MIKIVTLSSKQQITIPNDFLVSLGAQSVNKFLLTQEDETIIMRPLKTSLTEQLAGSLNKYVAPEKLGLPFEKIMEETKKIVAKKLATE